MEPINFHPNLPAPGGTGAHRFGAWLSVSDAVRYCTERGLTRTPKTVRKWAARSHERPEYGDVIVYQEDTDNGFRWLIESASLERKIDEELEFESRKTAEPVGTGAHPSGTLFSEETAQAPSKPQPNTSEPVHTSADTSAEAPAEDTAATPNEPGAHQGEPVRTGAEESDRRESQEAFLREQIAEKDRQLAKRDEQLERKDEQIMTMLERDRETNILIRSLQSTLEHTLGIAAPEAREGRERDRAGDNPPDERGAAGV